MTVKIKSKPRKSVAASLATSFESQGYVHLRNAITLETIDKLLGDYITLVNRVTGRNFCDAHNPDLATFFEQNPTVETAVYDAIRHEPWVLEFAQQDEIVNPVREILGHNLGMFKKAPFRIDMPMWTKDLALWHQDHFYVRGNTDIITAWIPMQDVNYVNGCLSIMPGSHLLGPVPHDVQIGKKFVPSSIFGNEIRMVAMTKGDVLIFSSLLLHNGNMNYSPSIRYSMQPRFTPLGQPTDPAMGGVIPL
jgi:ectoine hydroxylase-related dioxygenase (phytanoyl-CoA dioxygenase family)